MSATDDDTRPEFASETVKTFLPETRTEHDPHALVGLVISERYKIQKLLGMGAVGAVYLAEHAHMRKLMAIKVLHPEMSRLPEVVARFEREAMAAAHVDHPHVVSATDFGKLPDGSFFLALEFIEGKSLREAIDEGPLPPERALRIAAQITQALSRAHALGIVHRDLKPENVMLVERDGDPDFVKVLDFGIAKVPIGELKEGIPRDPAGSVLTKAGMIYGTPEYMSPEQALGQDVDSRADLYALGIMLFEMLTGTRPFKSESAVRLLGMHVTSPVPSMASVAPTIAVPAEIEAVVRTLLAKDASDRPADAKATIELFASCMSPNEAANLLATTGVAAAVGATPGAPVSASALETAKLPARGNRASLDLFLAYAKSNPTNVALVAASLFAIVLAGSLTVAAVKKEKTGEQRVDQMVAALVDAGITPPPLPPPSDEASREARIEEGIALVKRGDYGSGIAKLEPLATSGAHGEVFSTLAIAYEATGRPKDALKNAALALKAGGGAEKDARFRNVVREGALAKETSNESFLLLENSMGTEGWNEIYELAFGSGVQSAAAAQRAKKSLKRPDAKEKMGPALAITVDVRNAGATCEVRKLLERAAAEGDARTVTLLKPLMARKPGGFLGRSDALACLHDGALQKTIAAIEERTKAK